MTVQLSPWWLLALFLPVCLTGEWLCNRVRLFARFSIPPAVLGGLLVSIIVLACNPFGLHLSFAPKVNAPFWTWMVMSDMVWRVDPAASINLPFLMAVFTCVGMQASWSVLRKGTIPILIFWGISTVATVLQNVVGVTVARGLDQHPVLGLVCGSVSMTGGLGTALGFAPTFELAGLRGAGAIGAAAATFGLVAGSLIGAPVATRLIRQHKLDGRAGSDGIVDAPIDDSGFLGDVKGLWRRHDFWSHILILLFCMKVGAFVGWGLQRIGLLFPAHMGAMMMGVIVRNIHDLFRGKLLTGRGIDLMSNVLLGIFLSIAMSGINLLELATTALPMLAILVCQVVLMALIATYVTFQLMGRDYEAAVMAAGHIGFGLGAVPNAMASMQTIVRKYGPSPRAFLLVPTTGALLVDFTNAFGITFYLNFLKS
jgi:glutamate:Na+ symporter, ESS family